MREQIKNVLSELIRWDSGVFQFEGVDLPGGIKTSLDANEFLVDEGLHPEEMVLDPPDPRPGPEARTERGEIQRVVWIELQKLPDRYREAVILRDYHDMPYAEIAEVLQIPRGTLMSRLHRGRNMLREAVLACMGRGALTGREDEHHD